MNAMPMPAPTRDCRVALSSERNTWVGWPPSLLTSRPGATWERIWDPLQPTESERQMSPRVIASDHEVVVLWRQRGVAAGGERFDGEVLGLYEVRDAKFARAQMFYFDTAASLRFLHRADRDPSPEGEAGPRCA
jgi:hypothetical protein